MRAESRRILRGAAFACSLGVVALWIRFVLSTFAFSVGGVPAPGAFMVAILFGGVALAGGVAALKDVPVAVALTGLLSLVPVGLYLMLFPGSTRWIGILDGGMLAIGVALMRSDPQVDAVVSLPPPEPPTPDSAPPTWP